jgi:hypothetical protein
MIGTLSLLPLLSSLPLSLPLSLPRVSLLSLLFRLSHRPPRSGSHPTCPHPHPRRCPPPRRPPRRAASIAAGRMPTPVLHGGSNPPPSPHRRAPPIGHPIRRTTVHTRRRGMNPPRICLPHRSCQSVCCPTPTVPTIPVATAAATATAMIECRSAPPSPPLAVCATTTQRTSRTPINRRKRRRRRRRRRGLDPPTLEKGEGFLDESTLVLSVLGRPPSAVVQRVGCVVLEKLAEFAAVQFDKVHDLDFGPIPRQLLRRGVGERKTGW